MSEPDYSWTDLGSQRTLMAINPKPSVCEWIEEHFRLGRSYAAQGTVRLYPWQREVAEAIRFYDSVMYLAPTQTGKSMLCEAIVGYKVDVEPTNMMCAYAKGETVRDVFDERLRPLIEETPQLRRYWDGDPENLTKRRIKLQHLVIRVASANARSDLASHSAGFVYGDEVAKWPRTKGYNPMKLLAGRRHAVRMLGRRTSELLCTSPLDDQDYSYQYLHAPDTLVLQPHYPCPHCGTWQVLKDNQIKERPSRKGETDHDPGRIRRDNAAWYQCEVCNREITEAARAAMAPAVVWAAVDPKTWKTVENIESETVDRRVVAGRVTGRRRTDHVVYNWSRLADVTWTFAECLATYFEALKSPDGHTLADYQNEDMARHVRTSASRFAEGFLAKRARASTYKQYGADAYVPDGVLIMLIGMDTQDNGFYWVVRGYGKNLESWLVRAGFIACPMDERLKTDTETVHDFSNPAEVGQHVMAEINRYPYQRKDGKSLPIVFGLIDRGGHRADDVQAICQASGGMLMPYIGATRTDAQMVEFKSGKGGSWYYCNAEQLSRTVQSQMLQEATWHLPRDIQAEYCEQVLNQYEQEYTDTRGNTRKRWVGGDEHGRPDHFRDTENMLVASVHIRGLNEQLHTDTGQESVAAEGSQAPTERRHPESFNVNGNTEKWLEQGGWA